MFSDKLKKAIGDVSGQIAGDVMAGPEDDFKEILAETTLDADRLAIHGYVEEQAEMKELVKTHGWSTIVGLAEQYVSY